MSLRPSLIALALASALLAGCGKKDEAAPAGAGGQPAAVEAVAVKTSAGAAGAIETQAKAFRNNDLRTLVTTMMPPAELQRMRSEWDKKRAEPITEEDRQSFSESWGKLTAADGVDQMMAEIEPQLAEMRPQLPGLIAMMQGVAMMSIQQSETLTPDQKVQTSQLMNGMGGWLQKTDFADAATMRTALTALADGMRATRITTLEDAHALGFDEMLDRAGPALGGLKNALSAYGFSLDAVVDSVKTEVVSESGDSAKLKVSYQLFDSPLSFENEMRRVDGNWYSKDVIEQAEKAAAEAATATP